MGAIKSA